ncbi:hypothetical protein [Methylocella sp.]|jgi:hypothetical protein|uniref:hypothetical protein n=1 Tax=Methylocella sp. TaxID=1978226 RepID=UPI003C1B3840
MIQSENQNISVPSFATLKALSDCNPGDLVLLGVSGHPVFAIAVGGAAGGGVIALQNREGGHFLDPRHVTEPQLISANSLVICFGDEYRFEPDLRDPRFVFVDHQEVAYPTLVWATQRHDSVWGLRFRPLGETVGFQTPRFFELQSKAIIDVPTPAATFCSWKLWLNAGDSGKDELLLQFPTKPEEEAA